MVFFSRDTLGLGVERVWLQISLFRACPFGPKRPRFINTTFNSIRHTSSHRAARNGHEEVCRWLVGECGLEVCVLTLPRCVLTLLRCALSLPRCVLTPPRCVLTLPWCMCTQVDQPTSDGTTAFHWAVWKGHMTVCRCGTLSPLYAANK
jgi:hypothetical protein